MFAALLTDGSDEVSELGCASSRKNRDYVTVTKECVGSVKLVAATGVGHTGVETVE